MNSEQWVVEATQETNRALRLMPSRIFNEAIEGCYRRGISLAGVTRGLFGETAVSQLKEKAPEPSATLRDQDVIEAFKADESASIDFCRFLVNYLIGVMKQNTVTVNFRTADEKEAQDIRRALGPLISEISGSYRQNRQKEVKDGNGDSSPS